MSTSHGVARVRVRVQYRLAHVCGTALASVNCNLNGSGHPSYGDMSRRCVSVNSPSVILSNVGLKPVLSCEKIYIQSALLLGRRPYLIDAKSYGFNVHYEGAGKRPCGAAIWLPRRSNEAPDMTSSAVAMSLPRTK